MKRYKKWSVSCGAFFLAALLGLGVYTAGVYLKSQPLEQVKASFAAESKTQAASFLQSDALPLGKNTGNSYLTYAAAGKTSDKSEMFLIHNQPYLRVSGFPRFVSDAHYMAEQPVGYACTLLENVNGETVPTGFLFSSNQLEISNIDCQLKNPKTGFVQTVNIGVAYSQPFAEAFSLESDTMEIETMSCYDCHGNLVYSVGV